MQDTLEKSSKTELSWVRIFDPIHIPKKYIEQIKDRSFSVDKFIAMQKDACIENIDGKMVLNPFNLLYVLADEDKVVKGFCWMVVDALSNALVINSFSLDNEYWNKGKAVRLLEEKAKEIQEGAKLDRIFWITRCPKHSERHGFKRSKHVLMEYIGHGRNIHGEQSEADWESPVDDARTAKVS